MSRKLDGEYRSGNRNKAQIILIVVMVAALGILMWGKRENPMQGTKNWQS